MTKRQVVTNMFDAIALVTISDLEQPPKYEDIRTPAVLTVETETRAQTTQPDCQNAEGGAASTSASATNK